MSQQQQQLLEGIDAYLQRIGKDLPVGSKVRLRLVQGPLPTSSIDPVETASNSTTTADIIPKQSFPSILKFPPSSTQPPNFTHAPWHTGQGRLIIENVPKPQEDSDDEDSNNVNARSSKMGGMSDLTNGSSGVGGISSTGNNSTSSKPTTGGKKRWRYNRNVTPAKQWTVQDQVDFLETMVYRRKQLKYQKVLAQYRKRRMTHPNEQVPPLPQPPVPPEVRSTRYVGMPERLTSHHVLFTLQEPHHQQQGYSEENMDDNDDDDRNTATITVRTLPSMEQPTMIPMTQPAVRSHSSFATLSNAAQVMEDQRFAMSTTAASLAFRNTRPKLGNDPNHSNSTTATSLRVGGIRKINTTQSRLLQTLQRKEKAANKNEEEDGDDVMADVAYKERKGSSGGARRELLSTFGDGLKVSDDGVVLGGTNDTLFGGRGLKFNRFAVDTDKSNTTSNGDGHKTERGADGAAMADDFYTRDVGAEYEEMDYDAAEQFDDDDVDVGETEVQNVGTDGYNEDEYDDDDNDDDSDELNDDDDDAIGGAEGLASMAGYKALLAKARVDIQGSTATEKTDDNRSSSPTNATTSGTNNATTASTTTASSKNGDETKRSVSPKPEKGGKASEENNPTDHLARKMAAAEKTAQALKEKQKPNDTTLSSTTAGSNGLNGAVGAAAPQVDENGLRLITLDAVRREIWLNHGSIPINRLIKIFNANKKHGEVRQNKLKEVIKELCTMTTDPIHGRVLVLKQHYSHMS